MRLSHGHRRGGGPRRPVYGMAGPRRERTARHTAAVVCRLVDEACNASNRGIPDAVLAPGGGAPDPAAPGASGLDRERIKQASRLFRAAVPDASGLDRERIK